MDRCENKHFACNFFIVDSRIIIFVPSPPNSTTRMSFLPIRTFQQHAFVTIFTFLNFCYM